MCKHSPYSPIFALSGFPSLFFSNKKTNTYLSKYPFNTSSFKKLLVITYGGSCLPLSPFHLLEFYSSFQAYLCSPSSLKLILTSLLTQALLSSSSFSSYSDWQCL